MSRVRWLALGATAASIGIALVARGDAPPDQYAIFQAQTPTITDTHAKLEWERFPEDNRLAGDAGADGGMWLPAQDWANARDRCAKLGNGWRLPTVKELLTLVDEEPRQIYVDGATPFLYIDRNAFPTTHPEGYWTSSPSKIDVWTVNFGNGIPEPDKVGAKHFNRCVRIAP